MKHPSIEGYNFYVEQLQLVLQVDKPDLRKVKNLYQQVSRHKEYVLMTMRCADLLAEAAMQSRHHDAGMILVSDALEHFENAGPHYGTPEQTHHVLHNLIFIKLRLLACYKNDECDEAILEITAATLKQYPGIWQDSQSMHGIFYATQRTQALNRLLRHEDAAVLYLEMQNTGKRMQEPMLEAVGSLGWAYSILMGGKALALQGRQQEAVTAWRSAASVIQAWKESLAPDDDYDADFIVAHFWNGAYAEWLANGGGDAASLMALARTRQHNDIKALADDIRTHQLPFEQSLLQSLGIGH